MKGASKMEAKRWTLGVVLAAAVSLFGLIQADASPFSSYVLSDDLGNSVKGSAPQASDWDDGAGTDNGGGSDTGSSSGASSGASSGGGADDAASTGESQSGGTENDGHGNNTDGVDSSNRGQGSGGPSSGVDESCDGTGDCVDDEMSKGKGNK